jgi:small subunit ribosomal protein S1
MLVTGFNRGGLLVEGAGLQGFVPYSHLVEMNDHTEADRDTFFEKFIGRQLQVKIIECVPDEGRIVYSERAARAESGCRNRLFTGLKVGQCVNGEVTNITDFGVFVDLGGVEGLIHISELSWGRVEHPAQIAKLGEKLAVQVLDISPERCRVALSMKRLMPNPWETVSQRYAVNDIVPATITTVVSFGAFARLEDGLEGLVHVTEINLPVGKMVKDVYTVGQKLHVRILQVDAAHQRLGLSLNLE